MITNLLTTLIDNHYQNLVDNLKFSHELIPITIAIFVAGFIGFLESREFLSILINTEIIMLAINFHLITSSIL